MPSIQQLRSDLDELTRLAGVDLDVAWQEFAGEPGALALRAEVIAELAQVYGVAAGALAAEWYDDLRGETDVSGRFRAVAAATAERGQADALAAWSDTLEGAQGGLQRLVANVARDTVQGSSLADPQAQGWQRSASGGCGFCQMLASRGAVYTATTVTFGAHDHCRCVAVPAFSGQRRLVQPYRPSPRRVTDADRRRTRRWMAENGY